MRGIQRFELLGGLGVVVTWVLRKANMVNITARDPKGPLRAIPGPLSLCCGATPGGKTYTFWGLLLREQDPRSQNKMNKYATQQPTIW